MPRLFTGLEIDSLVVAEFAALRGGLPKARWVEPADYHLTLRFIGDVGRDFANDIAQGLADIRAATALVAFTDLYCFGGARPRALVARAAAAPALAALQDAHESLMRRLGLPAQTRKFTPHVTLAQLRGAGPGDLAPWLGAHPLPAMSFIAARFALFSARPLIGGGPYRREASFALA